jgi:hypothetical protein
MRGAALLMLLPLASSCGPKTIDIEVNVVASVCGQDQSLDPFLNVDSVQLRVSGPGIDKPIISQSAKSDKSLQVPQIPAGPARVIEVRGYQGDPSMGGKVLSVGRSIPTDIPDVITANDQLIQINVFLRQVNTFVQPSSAANPHNCSRMTAARAGHTATLLPDGRVFIAGGYDFTGTPPTATALSSAEFYDPSTGDFTQGPSLKLQNGNTVLERAYHTATLLQNGQVLIHGGEQYTANETFPVSSTLIFDLAHNTYGLVRPRTDPIGRTRHLAIRVSTGQVLLVGGLHRVPTTGVEPVGTIEWYDPNTASVLEVYGDSLVRTEAAGAAVVDAGFAAIAGGVDENGMLSSDVVLFSWTPYAAFDGGMAMTDAGSFMRGAPESLKQARRGAAATTLSDGVTMMVMGGFSNPTMNVGMDSSEAVRIDQRHTDLGPNMGNMRGAICAAPLGDSVMAIGGRDMSGSLGNSTLISPQAEGSLMGAAGPALPDAGSRYDHTCTTLSDGTVLVTGGVNEVAGQKRVLQDAWIYTPIPGN